MINKKPTPEQVASLVSMHSSVNRFELNKINSVPLKLHKNNHHVPSQDRTPEQEATYIKNIRYRIKYRETSTRKRLETFKNELDLTDVILEPVHYAKIIKRITRSNKFLQDILELKEKYGEFKRSSKKNN